MGLNDLLEQVAFRVYMQLLRVCYLVFFVGYSLGLLFRGYFACLFCPREVGVVSYYCAACRHYVIGIGPLIIIAVVVKFW